MNIQAGSDLSLLNTPITFAGDPFLSCIHDTFGFNCSPSARMS